MFQNFLKWRKENRIDTILQEFEFPEESKVHEFYPFNFHGVDKEGRPVAITRVGLVDCDKLFEITTIERMQTYFWTYHEVLMKLRFPACSEAQGRRIDTMTVIMDFTGVSMATLSKRAFDLI